jgi:two-component system cell cycle response regulator DivK
MGGESILIVDDAPVNLKLTRILLINEGFRVMTATSGEEALDLLRTYRPQLVLASVRLPGIDGLELTRLLKRDARTRDIAVVALTAFSINGDEQRVIDAGCDGYITKPVDTSTLAATIRQVLDRRAEAAGGPVAPRAQAAEHPIPQADLQALRRRFLAEGQEQTRQWLLDLDSVFSANDAARTVHQWIGAAGLLGYTAITRLARETEAVLLERPVEPDRLRNSLTNLALVFGTPRDAYDPPVPEAIANALAGKRIALVGLPPAEEQRLAVSLERVGAATVALKAGAPPDAPRNYHAAVVHFCAESAESPWLKPAVTEVIAVVLAGARFHLLAFEEWTRSAVREFLMEPWQAEEALLRLSRALARRPRPAPSAGDESSIASARPRVLVADDDPTVLALVSNALQNFGMECQTADNGPDAASAARNFRPDVAVLDVNMPGMDGYEVLSAIRAEQIPARVLLLSARQQESDVLRGFTLGADDYMVKPFSPLELVARLKRLIR